MTEVHTTNCLQEAKTPPTPQLLFSLLFQNKKGNTEQTDSSSLLSPFLKVLFISRTTSHSAVEHNYNSPIIPSLRYHPSPLCVAVGLISMIKHGLLCKAQLNLDYVWKQLPWTHSDIANACPSSIQAVQSQVQKSILQGNTWSLKSTLANSRSLLTLHLQKTKDREATQNGVEEHLLMPGHQVGFSLN